MEREFECLPKPIGVVNMISHSGYDTYSAINEFVDNSFGNEVKSTYCKVNTITDENGRIDKIIICDDGLSMDEETRKKFFSIGESNGSPFDLGNYGAGAKSGGFSMGKRITVYVKTKGSRWVKIWQDAEEIKKVGTFITHMWDEEDFEKEDWLLIEKNIGKNADSGTIFVIDKLFDTTKIFRNSFKETMLINARRTYSKFIEAFKKKLFIQNKEIIPISYTGGYNDKVGKFEGVLLDKGEIYLDGLEKYPVRWEAYHLPRTIDISVKDYDIIVNSRTCGFFIFRNLRLVGEGVKCQDIFTGVDHYLDGFRCLIYIDGKVDKHFGSTFNKMIKNGDAFSEELKEKLRIALSKSITESRKRREEERVDLKTQDEVKRDMDITSMIKKMLENAHSATAKAKQKIRYKFDNNRKKELYSKNLDSSRKTTLQKTPGCKEFERNILSVFGGFSVSYGYSAKDPIYDIRVENSQYHMVVNANHPWYRLSLAGVNNNGLAAWAISELGHILAIDTIEDVRGREKRLRYYEDIREKRDDYLRNIAIPEIDIYDDDEYSIEASDNCVGVGMTSDDFGITNLQNDELEIAIAAS